MAASDQTPGRRTLGIGVEALARRSKPKVAYQPLPPGRWFRVVGWRHLVALAAVIFSLVFPRLAMMFEVGGEIFLRLLQMVVRQLL